MEISDPTPNSFHLKEKFIIGNHNTYHPRLDAFNVSLSSHGTRKPYTFVELPAIHATEEVTSYVDQTVQIFDVEAFTAYNTLLVTREEVKLDIQGRTDLHEMRNPVTTVDYRKTVTLKGKSMPLSRQLIGVFFLCFFILFFAKMICRSEQIERFRRAGFRNSCETRSRRDQHDRDSLHPQSHHPDHLNGKENTLSPLTLFSPPHQIPELQR